MVTFDIVDGQQRLISISLFLHSLEKLKDYEGANNFSAEFGEISCYHARKIITSKYLTSIGWCQQKIFANWKIRSVSCIIMPEEQ